MATLTDAELARRAGVPVVIIAPIRTMESNGNARALRFEPHVFLRKTSGRLCDTSCTAAELKSSSHYGGRIPYTPSPGTLVSRIAAETGRAAFDRAFALDPQAAVESTSWGLYQVLGSAGIAAYGTPAAFLRAFSADPVEASQRLFLQYFASRPALRDAANRRDWHAFAEGYNGSDRWYVRFTELLNGGSGASVGGGVFALGAAALAFWAWRRMR